MMLKDEFTLQHNCVIIVSLILDQIWCWICRP